jgi:hypothetical protein
MLFETNVQRRPRTGGVGVGVASAAAAAVAAVAGARRKSQRLRRRRRLQTSGDRLPARDVIADAHRPQYHVGCREQSVFMSPVNGWICEIPGRVFFRTMVGLH